MKRFIYILMSVCLGAVLLIGSCAAAAVPSVGAQSAVLMEAESGEILINHNGSQRLPMASTTKRNLPH